MFIDTHCHLSCEDYDDIDLIIEENKKAGIEKIIISGCTKESILESIELSKKYENVYLTLGYHPSEVSTITNKDLELLETQLINTNKVVGIGEIGLDYHYGKEDMLDQQDLFRKQMVLAEKLNLPVVIHSRDATYDTIQCLKKYRVTGVIHCFSGSLETAREYIKMGFVLGIGGVVTFKNSNLKNVVEQISINDIVLETDSPYLTPTPYRGKQNSSKYIPLIALEIANLKKITVSEVAEITTSTAKKVFNLD